MSMKPVFGMENAALFIFLFFVSFWNCTNICSHQPWLLLLGRADSFHPFVQICHWYVDVFPLDFRHHWCQTCTQMLPLWHRICRRHCSSRLGHHTNAGNTKWHSACFYLLICTLQLQSVNCIYKNCLDQTPNLDYAGESIGVVDKFIHLDILIRRFGQINGCLSAKR